MKALVLALCAMAWAGPGRPDMAHEPGVGKPRPYHPPERQSFTLSNGVRVVLAEDHRFPLVSARLAVRGGSALAAKEPGLVEAMAELLTEGSSKRGAKEIAYEADAIGGEVSASASQDNVVVSAFALSEHAERMFALLAEVALDPAFPASEVELRKRNMLDELNLNRSQPEFLAAVAFYKQLYPGHPYGVIAPTEASIARIDRDKLVSMHRRLFSPANAIVVVTGDVAKGRLSSWLEARFSGWKGLGETLIPVPAPMVATLKRRVVLFDRPGSAQAVLFMGNPALTQNHPDYFPLLLANQVLGGSFGARLTTDLRERRGYTYGIYSGLSLHRSAGAFLVSTEFRNEVASAAVAAVLGHLERMQSEPVTLKELDQAKNTLIGEFARSLETQQGVANAVLHALLYDLPPDYLETYVDKVRAVQIPDVRRAAQDYFHPAQVLIAVVGDSSRLKGPLSAFSPAGIQKVDQDGEDIPRP